MCVSVSVTLAISMNFDVSFTRLSAAQPRKKNFLLPHYTSVFSPVPQADGVWSLDGPASVQSAVEGC